MLPVLWLLSLRRRMHNIIWLPQERALLAKRFLARFCLSAGLALSIACCFSHPATCCYYFLETRSLFLMTSFWWICHMKPNPAPRRTRRERRGCRRCVPCADGTTVTLHRLADAGSLRLGR